MYVYMYLYVYTCIYVSIYKYTYIYVHACMCVNVGGATPAHGGATPSQRVARTPMRETSLQVCACVPVSVFVFVSVSVSCLCLCLRLKSPFRCVCECVRERACVCVCTCKYIPTNVYLVHAVGGSVYLCVWWWCQFAMCVCVRACVRACVIMQLLARRMSRYYGIGVRLRVSAYVTYMRSALWQSCRVSAYVTHMRSMQRLFSYVSRISRIAREHVCLSVRVCVRG